MNPANDPALEFVLVPHTHWDREWFLTSIYTSRWIPGLIDRLAALAEQNPDFHFFLDGQTLVIDPVEPEPFSCHTTIAP